MPRQLQDPYPEFVVPDRIITIEEGGTGGSTGEQAANNLGGLSISRMGVPNGIAIANSLGQFTVPPNSMAVGEAIHGPRQLVHGQIAEYRITNYDSRSPVEVSISAGSVMNMWEYINVIAPDTGTQVVLTVNNRSIIIPLVAGGAVKPLVVSPTNGQSFEVQTITAVLDAFQYSPEAYGDWYGAYTNGQVINWPSNAFAMECYGAKGTSGIMKITMDGKNYLFPTSEIFRRIQKGVGNSFTVAISGTGMFSYRFITSGARHVSTDWQVASDAAFTTIVQQVLADTTNLISRAFTLPAGTYYVRGRFNGQATGGEAVVSPWSNGVRFTVVQNIVYPTNETQSFVSANAQAGAKFGQSIGMSGAAGIAAIGSPSWDHPYDGADVGLDETWTSSNNQPWVASSVQNTLTHVYSWSRPSGAFGSVSCVSHDGMVLAVSAPNASTGNSSYPNYRPGSVVMYDLVNGIWTARFNLLSTEPGITPSSFSTEVGHLGTALAISGNGSIVVAGNQELWSTQGRVYIFTRSANRWDQVQALGSPEPQSRTKQFGTSVAISRDGTYIAVGSYNSPGGSLTWAGVVYIYKWNGTGWVLESSIIPSDRQYMGLFGCSLAFSSDASMLIVGARGNTHKAAYVFTRSGVVWSQQAKLVASDVADDTRFGQSVSLSENGAIALVGAPYMDNKKGAAYVYSRSGTIWTQRSKLQPAAAAANDLFGSSVLLSSDGVKSLIGAPGRNSNTGAVYLYK